jgi:hypothetical protein
MVTQLPVRMMVPTGLICERRGLSGLSCLGYRAARHREDWPARSLALFPYHLSWRRMSTHHSIIE